MGKKLHELISSLKTSSKTHKLVICLILVFAFIYVFSIPAFSMQGKLKYISYFSLAALGFLTLIYYLLFLRFNFNSLILIPFAFVVIALVGTLSYSHDYRRWFTLVLMFVTFLIYFFATKIFEDKRLLFKVIIFAFLAFALYFAIYPPHLKVILKFQISNARLGHFDNSNTIGFYFSLAFIMSTYLGLMFKKKKELFYLLCAAIFFFLGLFTGSRSFIVVSFLGAIVNLFIRFRRKKIIFVIVLGVLIGLFFILINIPELSFLKDQFDRAIYTIFGIGNSKVDHSTVERAVWSQYAYTLSGKNAIFGYGVNGFASASGLNTYAHNNFVEVLCDFGALGFICYYFFIGVPLIKSLYSKNEDIYLVFVVVLVYLVRGLFGVSYYSKDSYCLLAVCYALTDKIKIPWLQKKNDNVRSINCIEVKI